MNQAQQPVSGAAARQHSLSMRLARLSCGPPPSLAAISFKGALSGLSLQTSQLEVTVARAAPGVSWSRATDDQLAESRHPNSTIGARAPRAEPQHRPPCNTAEPMRRPKTAAFCRDLKPGTCTKVSCRQELQLHNTLQLFLGLVRHHLLRIALPLAQFRQPGTVPRPSDLAIRK